MRRLILLFLVLLTCRPAKAQNASEPYNIVLIAIDGLRADHVGAYGYKLDTSPNIDRLAAGGIQFQHAYSQSSWTLPSFSSMFTSQYPQSLKVFHMGQRLSGKEPILAELLRQHGYHTAGFVGGPFLEPNYGFARGFDLYRSGGSRSFRDTTPLALDWIKQHKNDRFFVFLHGNDVHPPFDLPNEGENVRIRFDQNYKGPVDEMQLDYYFVRVFNRIPLSPAEPQPDDEYLAKVDEIRNNPRDIRHIIAHHDNQVAYADQFVGETVKALGELGLAKRTIVVVMADHGLELDEKGKLCTGYHTTNWETITHVPLIISHPDLAPRKVDQLVELVDLAPTLLDFAGVPAPSTFEGESLAPMLRDPAKGHFDRKVAFSSSSKVDPTDRIPMFSIRDDRWKLIFDDNGNKSQLYDLKTDPGETHDLAKKDPAKALELTQELLGHIQQTMAPLPAATPTPANGAKPPQDLLKRLQKAGYW